MEQLNGNEPFTLHGSDTSIILQDFWRWSCSDLLNNTQRGVLAEFLVHSALGAKMQFAQTGSLLTSLLLPDSGLRLNRLLTCRPGLRKIHTLRSSLTLQRNLPGMELPTPLRLCVTMICMCSASLPLVHVMFQSWTWTTGTFMYSLHRFLMRRFRNRRKSLCPLFSNWNRSKRISPACLRLWNQ